MNNSCFFRIVPADSGRRCEFFSKKVRKKFAGTEIFSTFALAIRFKDGNCGNSSVGRAQPCQGWGREFESRFPLSESATYRNGVADFLFAYSDKTRLKQPFQGAAPIASPLNSPLETGSSSCIQRCKTMTFKVILRKDVVCKNLTSPLCLLFFHDNRKKSVGLGVAVAREYRDAETQKVREDYPNRDGCGQLPANVPSARRRCNG